MEETVTHVSKWYKCASTNLNMLKIKENIGLYHVIGINIHIIFILKNIKFSSTCRSYHYFTFSTLELLFIAVYNLSLSFFLHIFCSS
jgi:hypothetical protein